LFEHCHGWSKFVYVVVKLPKNGSAFQSVVPSLRACEGIASGSDSTFLFDLRECP
jgi:hypothetical protein